MGRLNGYYSSLSEEDRLLVSHLLDMLEICEKSYQPRFSCFLNEHEALLAENVMTEQRCEGYRLYGGYEEASRKILGIFPPYWDDTEDFPIAALAFKYREADRLSHRDFLGAFMSKQIKRNVIGDIIIENGSATAFVHSSVKDALMFEISKIGSVGVKVTEVKDPVIHAENNFTEKSGTVSSLRLDSIVGMA
ncbi:MAG: YlmH/Sll1252 family protein, partial [Muribaculaceae bacterium]|nr:YlmH/Sll1252 family protein [Muribaculaceae bacterium]